MATSSDGAIGGMAGINVTPMIDILLVLLIVFMVIVPVAPEGLRALVPRPPETGLQSSPERAIVVQVFDRPGQAPAYRIDGTGVTHAELLPRLTQIFANRAQRTMFVKADDSVSFRFIADVIDIGRAASADRIGLMTPMAQAR